MFLKSFLTSFRSLPFIVRNLSLAMQSPIVTIKQGKVQGSTNKLNDGTPYYSFKGIPYALPPLGRLRFAAPQPPKSWTGVYNATEHKAICPQFDIFTMQPHKGNEDCLFLNVYTPSLAPSSKLPVMVWIHGGAFMSGSGDSEMYGPEFLLQHNVILVTINYRLEIFGYLCLDTPEVPGNAGMKDQVAALRWVQGNIERFGGDPDNVTLFGESAGGAAVTYHMVSPMSKGLFHKAISQSGVCIADWTIAKRTKERAFRIGKFLGKDTNDVAELTDFFMNISSDKLANSITFKTLTTEEKARDLPLQTVPVVEKKFDGVEAFLTEEPLDIILNNKINKVPLIIGYNSREGIMGIPPLLRQLDVINKKPKFLLTRELFDKLPEEKKEVFGRRIKTFYFGDEDIQNTDLEAMADNETDKRFAYNIHRFTDFYARAWKYIYLYNFDCDTELNFTKKFIGIDLKGACHADDLFYLFANKMLGDIYENDEKLKQLIYRITKMWTNFAKTGNPTPDNSLGLLWHPYSANGMDYLHISEELSMKKDAIGERIRFWNKLYSEAGLPSMTKSNL